MRRFDELFAAGQADQGDNQNGKGDSFTDLVCLLLQNCSGKTVGLRPGLSGRIFTKHALDAAYPKQGLVELFIETKAAGAPKGVRNPTQKNALGRRGSADLDKRIKEAGLKAIDLKAEWSRQEGKGGGPGGDFVTWLRHAKPSSYLLMSVRVIGEADLERTVHMAQCATSLMDACGLYCYGPRDGTYIAFPVPRDLDMDLTISRICDHLRHLP